MDTAAQSTVMGEKPKYAFNPYLFLDYFVKKFYGERCCSSPYDRLATSRDLNPEHLACKHQY